MKVRISRWGYFPELFRLAQRSLKEGVRRVRVRDGTIGTDWCEAVSQGARAPGSWESRTQTPRASGICTAASLLYPSPPEP